MKFEDRNDQINVEIAKMEHCTKQNVMYEWHELHSPIHQ